MDSSLLVIDGPVNSIMLETDNLLSDIRGAITSLTNADAFLSNFDRKLSETLNSLISRENQLYLINSELEGKGSELRQIESMNIEHLINPFLLNLKPLFTGSGRLVGLKDLNLDLTKEQQRRLISVGTVQMLIPMLLVLMICFISVIISNIITIDEKQSPAFTRSRIIPVGWPLQVISIYLTVIFIVLIQIAVILGIGYTIFFLDFANNIGMIISSLTLMIIIYSSIGIGLGYLINSPMTSLLVSSFFLIVNIFISGMAFPVERMSPIMLKLSAFIPFREGVSVLQQSIFYNILWTELIGSIGWLTGLALSALIFMGFSYIIFLRTNP